MHLGQVPWWKLGKNASCVISLILLLSMLGGKFCWTSSYFILRFHLPTIHIISYPFLLPPSSLGSWKKQKAPIYTCLGHLLASMSLSGWSFIHPSYSLILPTICIILPHTFMVLILLSSYLPSTILIFQFLHPYIISYPPIHQSLDLPVLPSLHL